MVKEHFGIHPKELSGMHEVLGFPGGKCDEDLDADIGQTMIREIYEECFLNNILPSDWNTKWLTIRNRIANSKSSTDVTEQFLFRLYSSYIGRETSSYIYGKHKLKVIYFRFFLSVDDIKLLRTTNNMVPVSSNLLIKLIETKQELGIDECVKRKYIINDAKMSIRQREVEAMDANFLKFLNAPEPFESESDTKEDTETEPVTEPVTEPSREPSREYLILVDRVNWQCFIPEDEFNKYFSIVPIPSLPEEKNDDDRATVVVNREQFGSYSSPDTYLQSYCLWHARSCVRPGKWNIHLLGVYHLDKI